MSNTFLVKISNNEIDFGSEWNVSRWREFKRENEGKWLRIEKPKSLRSNRQNSYYWAYLEIVSHETGNLAEDLHEFFREKLLPKKFIVIHGKKGDYEIEKRKSTTELSKIEFGEYLDKICSVCGVELPDPSKLEGYISDK